MEAWAGASRPRNRAASQERGHRPTPRKAQMSSFSRAIEEGPNFGRGPPLHGWKHRAVGVHCKHGGRVPQALAHDLFRLAHQQQGCGMCVPVMLCRARHNCHYAEKKVMPSDTVSKWHAIYVCQSKS